jgi:hypothetical protein
MQKRIVRGGPGNPLLIFLFHVDTKNERSFIGNRPWRGGWISGLIYQRNREEILRVNYPWAAIVMIGSCTLINFFKRIEL